MSGISTAQIVAGTDVELGNPPPKTTSPQGNVAATSTSSTSTSAVKKGLFIAFIVIAVIILIAAATVAAVVKPAENDEEGLGDSGQGTESPTSIVNDDEGTESPTDVDQTFAPTDSPIQTVSPTDTPTTPVPTEQTDAPTDPPTDAPTTEAPTTAAPVSLPVFPEEVRNGNDYVGLLFIEDPGEVAAGAFINAAETWSEILEGTVPSTVTTNILDACGTGLNIQNVVLDHIRILAFFGDIEEDGVIGRAGPCNIVSNNNLVIVGSMIFDEPFFRNESAETLETTILHEMGHVFGLGTLWGARFVFNLVEDEVNFPNIGSFPDNQPKYISLNAREAYGEISNQADILPDFVPVEDGKLNGVQEFTGSGSIDGHWDRDFFRGELMEARLSVGAPISLVTLASLQDLGLTVDLTKAGVYTALPFSSSRRSIDIPDDPKSFFLGNDARTDLIVVNEDL